MPGLFEQFPHTNLHELNLDWMIDLLNQFKQELEDRAVISVNGMTGEVTLYESENVVLPPLTGASSWRLVRMMDGQYVGIIFQDGHIWLQQGNSTLKLLTTEDIPTSAGVVSINGMGGVVTLTGRDIALDDSPDADSIRLALETEHTERVNADNALSNSIDVTNQALSNLTTPTTASDLNTVTTTGVVFVNDSTSNRPHDWCIVYTYAVNSTTLAQMAFCISDTMVYYRRNNGSWSAWEEIAKKSDIDALKSDYLTKEINGTTDRSGDITMDVLTNTYIPLAFVITGGEISKTAGRIFFQSADGGNWWVKFVDDANITNVTNKTITGTLYYKKI